MEKTLNLDLSGVKLLIVNKSAWGNRKKADSKKIQSSADKKMLSVSKKLIDSEEFIKIQRLYNEIDQWIDANSVPSFYIKSQNIFRKERVEEVVDYLNSKLVVLDERVNALAEVFKQQQEEAKITLNDLYRASDYPSIEELKSKFSIRWSWLRFDVPEDLPEKIFKEEKAKAEARWAESTELIAQCLREAFSNLITHAKDVLTPKKGKVIGFKNASFNNISEFIETFNNRNIVNDRELEKLVNKAKEILLKVENPQDLKTDSKLRNNVSTNFAEISAELSTMIEVKPSRKFNLDD